MKALSLWQPWASAIALGHKTIETRSWPTNYRGPIAIHAAKRPMDLVAELLASELRSDPLPFGAIVALADLVGVVPTADCYAAAFSHLTHDALDRHFVGYSDHRWGNFTPGRWAWYLANIRRIEPVPAKGMQGLWEWAA